jgi:hypothetical protein
MYVTRALNRTSRKQVRHVIKYIIFEGVKTVLMTIQGSSSVTARRLFYSRYGVTSQQTRIFDTTYISTPPKKTSFPRTAKDDLGLKIQGL